MVASAATAMAIMAVTQPNALISAWFSGANTNWPKLPPALMKPAAKARLSAGRRPAVAPIRIEKLPAPAPADDSTPERQEQHPRRSKRRA